MKLRTMLLATATLIALPAVAQAEPFNGPYVGAQAGWDKHEAAGNGVSYGAIAGYNVKVSENAVIGLEGSVDFSSATGTIRLSPSTAIGKYDIGRQLGISGRAGFLAGPSTLFYVKTGYENIGIKVTNTAVSPVSKLKSNIDTIVLGTGVEHALNDTTSFRINYDYANGKGGYNRHRVLAGVAFHF